MITLSPTGFIDSVATALDQLTPIERGLIGEVIGRARRLSPAERDAFKRLALLTQAARIKIEIYSLMED